MDKLKIVKEVTELVTGKTVVLSGGFEQNETEIFGTGWMEILHELSHWIVATEEERLHPNLGFSKHENGMDCTDHNYRQEIRASELNHHLNMILGFDTKCEEDYDAYVREAKSRIPHKYSNKDIEYINDGLLERSDVKNIMKLILDKI